MIRHRRALHHVVVFIAFGISASPHSATRPLADSPSMVYLPPPHLASAHRPSYAEAYNRILATHRRSPLTSASSVIILVAPDVDALCAARMLADLLHQDDVMHRLIPVSGIADLEKKRDELLSYNEVGVVTPLQINITCITAAYANIA